MEFAETNNWRLTSGPSYEGFGRRPCAGRPCEMRGPAFESLPRRKPRGGRALFGWAAIYGDLRIAEQTRGVGAEAGGAPT